MEKKIEKKFSVSEKLTALQIAQSIGFDGGITANEERHLSALFDRAEKILEWTSYKEQPNNPYFVRKDIKETI